VRGNVRGILAELAAAAQRTMLERKAYLPIDKVLADIPVQSPPSFERALAAPGLNVIAEIKYAGPGNAGFSCTLPPGKIGRVYADSGAAAISVLTEKNHFRGSLENLSCLASEDLRLPLLRKDFIVDDYQIAEARAAGASSYLLIAALLEEDELRRLIGYGRELQMEPLVEVHCLGEMEAALGSGAGIIGVNNRNLNDLTVSLGTSFALARELGGGTDVILVSESGISDRVQMQELREAGYQAFLIGTALMASPDPGGALRKLLGKPDAD
jgi:indole-3-glycerol phosphate synthase